MRFGMPVPRTAVITQTFSEHVRRAQANGWKNYNGGIDWAIPTGTPIKAAQKGTVKRVRHDATGYGNHVIIQHDDGYETVYAHLMDFGVSVGNTVKAGDMIGRSDNTGNSTGPHLHFELRKDGLPVDPMPLLENMSDIPDEPSPQPPKPIVVGGRVVIGKGWNFRDGPSTTSKDIGTSDWLMGATVREVQGEFVKVQTEFWVHKGALTS